MNKGVMNIHIQVFVWTQGVDLLVAQSVLPYLCLEVAF